MRNTRFKVRDSMRKVRFEVRHYMRNARFELQSGEGVWLGSEVGVEIGEK